MEAEKEYDEETLKVRKMAADLGITSAAAACRLELEEFNAAKAVAVTEPPKPDVGSQA